MNEIFKNVSEDIKRAAEFGWEIAMHKSDPVDAANFLNDLTNYYKESLRSEEEIEFLQFYFNMKMMESNKNA